MRIESVLGSVLECVPCAQVSNQIIIYTSPNYRNKINSATQSESLHSPGIFSDPPWGGGVSVTQFFLEAHLYYAFFLTKCRFFGQNDICNNHFHPSIFPFACKSIEIDIDNNNSFIRIHNLHF